MSLGNDEAVLVERVDVGRPPVDVLVSLGGFRPPTSSASSRGRGNPAVHGEGIAGWGTGEVASGGGSGRLTAHSGQETRNTGDRLETVLRSA